jgi:branched-chain amino acid transport system substrate-binding protein
MKRFSIPIFAFALVFVSVSIGGFQCPAFAEQKTLKIGILMPLTGFGAAWGIPVERATHIMVAKINEEGGVKVGGDTFRLEASVADTEGKAEVALAKANKFIFDEKIKYIVGPIFGGPLAAVQSISEPNKVLIMPTCYSPKTLGPDLKYTFRLFSSGRENMDTIFPFIKKYFPKVKTIALTGLGDERETVVMVGKMAEGAGYQVVSIEHVPPGTTDWFPVLTKVTAKNPDAFIPVSAPPPEAAMILQQLHQLGYKGLKITPSHYLPEHLVAKAGVEATEGFIFMAPDFGPNGPPALRYLQEKYLQKYGKPFDPVTAACFCFLDVLKQGIEKAGTLDTTAVMQTMENLSGTSVKGPFSMGGVKTYGIKRQIIESVHFSQMSGGGLKYIGEMTPSVP